MAKKEKVAKVAKTVTAKVAKAAKTVKAAMTDKKNVITPADAKIPAGPLAEKWTNYKTHQKLVNPANKRRLDVCRWYRLSRSIGCGFVSRTGI